MGVWWQSGPDLGVTRGFSAKAALDVGRDVARRRQGHGRVSQVRWDEAFRAGRTRGTGKSSVALAPKSFPSSQAWKFLGLACPRGETKRAWAPLPTGPCYNRADEPRGCISQSFPGPRATAEPALPQDTQREVSGPHGQDVGQPQKALGCGDRWHCRAPSSQLTQGQNSHSETEGPELGAGHEAEEGAGGWAGQWGLARPTSSYIITPAVGTLTPSWL